MPHRLEGESQFDRKEGILRQNASPFLDPCWLIVEIHSSHDRVGHDLSAEASRQTSEATIFALGFPAKVSERVRNFLASAPRNDNPGPARYNAFRCFPGHISPGKKFFPAFESKLGGMQSGTLFKIHFFPFIFAICRRVGGKEVVDRGKMGNL
jgi:hypothetical protein